MFPNDALRVTDPASNLECSLTLLSGTDGGVSGIVVELGNPSADHDLIVKVNSETAAFITLTLTDQQGVELSGPAAIADTSQAQHFDEVRIARSSSHRWQVPIADQVSAEQLPEQGVSGRLVVTVALQFAVRGTVGDTETDGDGRAEDHLPDTGADFGSSLLTLYDMDVRFTRAALREGATPVSSD